MKTLLHDFLPMSYPSSWTYDTNTRGSSGSSNSEPLLEPLIRAYIASQGHFQTLQTKSGDLWSGGLNEPKYMLDGTVFDGDWGRPQRWITVLVKRTTVADRRDGPALRALTLIPYAHFLLDRGNPLDLSFVKENLYDPSLIRAAGKVIKNDLEEVAAGWFEGGFDLWEEM